MNHVLGIVAVAVSLVGCGAIDGLNGGSSARSDDDPKTFIALGDAGRSGEFNNVVTLFVRLTDLQPTCDGCRAVRVVYDGYDPHGPLGTPVADTVRINLEEACDGGVPTEAVKAAAIRSRPYAAVQSEPLIVAGAPERCRPDGFVKIELIGMECLNPTVDSCRDRVVKESYRTTMEEILALDYVEGRAFPNRVPVSGE